MRVGKHQILHLITKISHLTFLITKSLSTYFHCLQQFYFALAEKVILGRTGSLSPTL